MIPVPLEHVLDLGTVGDRVIWPVSNAYRATAQATLGKVHSGWSSGVITLYISNDGIDWYAIGSGVSFSADGLSGVFDLCYGFLAAEVTTAASSGNPLVKIKALMHTETP